MLGDLELHDLAGAFVDPEDPGIAEEPFGIVALDFDNAVVAGKILPEVAMTITGTYAEFSPSGTGQTNNTLRADGTALNIRGYNTRFVYPTRGIGALPDGLARTGARAGCASALPSMSRAVMCVLETTKAASRFSRR